MFGRTLDFQCQHQQLSYKISDRKIKFCSKFAVEMLPLLMLTLDDEELVAPALLGCLPNRLCKCHQFYPVSSWIYVL